MGEQTLALVRGTLVKPVPTNDNLDEAARSFERAVDDRRVWRRLGPAQVRRNGETAELRVDVEYGPVLGGYPADLRRQLHQIADDGGRVEGYSRRELNCPEAVSAAVSDLIARRDDVSLPEATRWWMERTVMRLRLQFPYLQAGEDR